MNIQDEHQDDAVNVAGHLHEILYEDDKMRVLKVTVNPGDEAAMHWHPRNMNYILQSGSLSFTDQQNNSKEVFLNEGDVTSWKQEGFHAVVNTGDTIVQTIQVELKD